MQVRDEDETVVMDANVADCIKGKLHWRVSAVMDANVVTLLIERFEWPQLLVNIDFGS